MTDDLTHYPPLGTCPSPRHVADWERLCAWLEEQPYNASYKPAVCDYLLLTVKRYSAAKYGQSAYEQVQRMDAERRALDLVFWSSGNGWRLRKDYAAKLVILKQKFGAERI